MFGKGRARNAVIKNEVDKHPTIKYPNSLSFYDRPPIDDITIEEFETCALDRLRILAEIESSFARNRTGLELAKFIKEQCNTHYPLHPNSLAGDDKTKVRLDYQVERRRDHVGHFVLRLAFCRSEELRRRFIKAEVALFKTRYDAEPNRDREDFLHSRDFDWQSVDMSELALYKAELSAVARNLQPAQEVTNDSKYFKVRWSRVPDLVEKRQVFLKGGMAYVPQKQQSSIVFEEFQTALEKALEMTARALPRLDEDTRIIPILDNIAQGFLTGISASTWNSSSGDANSTEVTADMIDELSRKHFPACMRHLHESLRRDRHLRHNGRLQYGLFLKVLGLSIDEALLFWRRSFSSLTDDKFKEHRYNIRHSYGLEGRRANYPARSCQQILTGPSPADGDAHGCPYRHFSPENLSSFLLSYYGPLGFSSGDFNEILAIVKSSHYHVACTRVFEVTHQSATGKHGEKISAGGPGTAQKGEGVGGGESVTHPNQYVERSRALEKIAKGEGAGVKQEDGDVEMTE